MSESLIRRLGIDQPIGRRILLTGSAQAAEIVGVVGDVKHRALDEDNLPTIYLSAWQTPLARVMWSFEARDRTRTSSRQSVKNWRASTATCPFMESARCGR